MLDLSLEGRETGIPLTQSWDNTQHIIYWMEGFQRVWKDLTPPHSYRSTHKA